MARESIWVNHEKVYAEQISSCQKVLWVKTISKVRDLYLSQEPLPDQSFDK